MLFVSISHLKQLETIPAIPIEVRIDLLPFWEDTLLKKLLVSWPNPIMLTLRSTSHGGFFSGNRKETLLKLAQLEPDFLDIEYDIAPQVLPFIPPNIKRVISYHNFSGIPDHLSAIYEMMQTFDAYAYKIAVFTPKTTDALKMLLFAKEHPKVSMICMGEKGSFARILGPKFGNIMNFASIDQETAPGQLTWQELYEMYHYPHISPKTEVYGLIGSPVDHSIGHIYHNAVFAKEQRDAVYVKMDVKREDLPQFFNYAKLLDFKGLSVTTPLKESVFPFIDHPNHAVQTFEAANTLVLQDGQIFGKSTDGIGAMDAVERRISLKGKKIVLLGAGGAAKSLCYEALRRKAKVHIVNRTLKRAEGLAHLFGCSFGPIPDTYDALINCTSHEMPMDESHFFPSAIVMDLNYRIKESIFLQKARHCGCQIIYGDEMFEAQAKAQQNLWKRSQLPPHNLKQKQSFSTVNPS